MNIVRETISNLLLQIAHIPDSSFRLKLEFSHSRPAENSSKVLRLLLIGSEQVNGCPEGSDRPKGDRIL